MVEEQQRKQGKGMEEYETCKVIGRGAFAVCTLCRRKRDGRRFVIKRMSTAQEDLSEREKDDVANEIKVLATLNHPNIIQYVASFLHENTQHIVMEYASGGTLHRVIQKSQKDQTHFSEARIWEWFAQMVVAIRYVHGQHILHRDIKTQNMLLWGESRRVVKVADFGIAKVLSTQHHLAATCVGTPYYLSPELCEGKVYDQKSDIWALGCVLFELMALQKPFQSSNIPSLVLAITRGERKPLPDSAQYSGAMTEVLDSMLALDPKDRPTIDELYNNRTVNKKIMLWEAIADEVMEAEAHVETEDACTYVANSSSSPPSLTSPMAKMESLRRQSLQSGTTEPIASPEKTTQFSTGNFTPRRQSLHQTSNSRLHSRLSNMSSHSGGSSLSIDSLSDLSARRLLNKLIVENRRVFRWGNGQRKPILDEKLLVYSIMKIASPLRTEDEQEYAHALALTEEGSLLSWGAGAEGRLGHGRPASNSRTPKEIDFFQSSEIRIQDAGCGDAHSVAIACDGSIWLWGDIGSCGGLSHLGLTKSKAPLAVAAKDRKQSKQSNRPVRLSDLAPIEELSRGSVTTIDPSKSASDSDQYIGLLDVGLNDATSNKGLSPTMKAGHPNSPAKPIAYDTEFIDEEDDDESMWPSWAREQAGELRQQEGLEATDTPGEIRENPFASPRGANGLYFDSEEEDEDGDVQNGVEHEIKPKQFLGESSVPLSSAAVPPSPPVPFPLDNPSMQMNPINDRPNPAISPSNPTEESLVREHSVPGKPGIKIGARVDIPSKQWHDCGVIRFIGLSDFAKGIWVGIELDEPYQGKNDGCVQGRRYFTTTKDRGLFLRLASIRPASETQTSMATYGFATMDSRNGKEEQKAKKVPSEEENGDTNIDTDLAKIRADPLPEEKEEPWNYQENIEMRATETDDEEIDAEKGIVYAPRRVRALESIRVIQVACGKRFTVVLSKEGQIFGWGANDYGQLGTGDDEDRDRPCAVKWPNNIVVKKVAAGGEFVLALTGKDEIYSWGRGSEGQLGLGHEVFDEPNCLPQAVVGISSPVRAIAAGGAHCAAVTTQGEIYTWGDGTKGQLGHGDYETQQQPMLVEELARSGEDQQVVSVAAGAYHTLALTDRRTVYSWGCGKSGKLGHATDKGSALPKVVSTLTGYAVCHIGCTSFASYAITKVENPQDGL